ncbi:c-type cytochrome [Sandaracinobacteroides saxicola]|uniref:Cytochrome c n=1 Tax=Sandaracinobacteroides saxicola TaxID=2759707 RepID=A0A7G5II10_9SPHN|nr:cytochrome c [Sandaracinobacteroides saxicola]QMW23002.1 cytochrome c [Sandaracinobacteroides saxicola]
MLKPLPLLAILLTMGAPALAQPAKVIEARQANFKAMGRAMKAMGDEFRGGSPDIAVFRTNAATLNRLAPDLPKWFPAGSGTGAKTEAKADIWSKPGDFAKAAANFAAAANALNTAAAGTDIAAVGAALRATGGTCKACHDQFREEKK